MVDAHFGTRLGHECYQARGLALMVVLILVQGTLGMMSQLYRREAGLMTRCMEMRPCMEGGSLVG